MPFIRARAGWRPMTATAAARAGRGARELGARAGRAAPSIVARATPGSRGRARDRASSQFPARAHSDITVRGPFYMAYGERCRNLSHAKDLGPPVYRA